MKISIVTPCYNSEQFIDETIESVINQRGDFEIEYILIDGKSTDQTINIINNYKKKIDSPNYKILCNKISMIMISEKDNGMYDAIQKGLNLASGDIIAYINSDDYYLPNAFTAVKTVFDNYRQIHWITGIINGYNEFGNITLSKLPYYYSSEFIQKGIYGDELPFIQQESCFWRKNLLEKINLAKISSFRYAGDFFLWHEFSKYANLRILNIPISGFRKHESNKSNDLNSYMSEFNSIVSKQITYKDKVKLYFEKRRWNKSSEEKLTLNREIIDLSQRRLRYLLDKNKQIIVQPHNKNVENSKASEYFFTIITVTYNAEKYIEDTIKNIISQQNCNFEYIIIDGASTDKTTQIIKNYENSIDVCLSESDSGLYDAMNKGIIKAKGKYIIFMNAGDTFSNHNILETIESMVDTHSDEIIYGDRFYIHENGEKTLQKANPIESVFERMPFGHQSCFVKTNILKKTPFNTTYKYGADYDLIIKLYLEGKRFKYIELPICNFLHGGTSESGIRPYLEALKILFDNCNDKEIIKRNQYFKSFKNNCASLLDI